MSATLLVVIGALSHGARPPFGFGAIVALEAAVSQGGPDVRRLEGPMTVADLAQPAFGAASRGTIVDMICGSPVASLNDTSLRSPKASLCRKKPGIS